MNRLCIVLLLLTVPAVAHAETYYVAKNGSDGNTCLQARDSSSSRLTVRAGLTCLSGGDTLVIHAGTYAEGIDPDAIPAGLSNSQRTIVKAASGQRVVLDGRNRNRLAMEIYDRSFITIDGIWFDGSQIRIGSTCRPTCDSAPGAHYITFENGGVVNVFEAGYGAGGQSCITHHGIDGSTANITNIVYRNLEVSGGGPDTGHGIYMAGISDSIVESCVIHDNSGHGIHQYNSNGRSTSHRNVYRNNTIYNNGSYGILLGSGTANLAYNNIVHDNGKRVSGTGGIWTAYNGAAGNRIYNNTIFRNNGPCIRIRTDETAGVRNNICWRNSGTIIDETGTAVISHNLFTNPSFRSMPNNDVRLLATSTAIDAGLSLGEVPDDFRGVARPQGSRYDIGANEFTGDRPPPAPPTGIRVN